MSECIIYALFDPREPEVVRYVGKTSKLLEFRVKCHVKDALYGKRNRRCNWLRKILAEGVTPQARVLEVVDEPCWQDSERKHIAAHKTEHLTNGTLGGEGACGRVISEEQKQASRERRLGTKHSPETIEKIRLANVGRRNSPEAIAKVAEFHRGRKRSDETRRKISLANKGKPGPRDHMHFTPEQKAEIGARLAKVRTGTKHKPETIEKMRESRRAWWASKHTRL